MHLLTWTTGLVLLAELSAATSVGDQDRSLSTRQSPEHDAYPPAPTTPESVSSAHAIAPRRGLDFDLNLPPPIEVESHIQGPRRGSLMGSINNGLQGWKAKRERTPRRLISDSSEDVMSLESKEKGSDEYRVDQGDSKRMRRLASLNHREKEKSIPRITGAHSFEQQHRILPSRQVKGKAVAFADKPSSYYDSSGGDSSSKASSSSSSGFQSVNTLSSSSQSDGSSSGLQKKFQRDTATSSRSANQDFVPFLSGKTTSKKAPIRKWKNAIPGSRTDRRQIDQKKFYEEWDKHNFNSKIDPKVMAHKVLRMNVNSLNQDRLGRYAAAEIRKGAGSKYFAKYYKHLKNTKTAMYRVEAKLQKAGKLNGMDPEARRSYIVDKAAKRNYYGSRSDGNRRRVRPVRDVKAQIRLDNVERAARTHLTAKKIDFDKAPLATIEKEMRDINFQEHGVSGNKASSVNGLYQVLKNKRKATDADVQEFQRTKKSERNRRAVKKMKQSAVI